MKAVYLILVYFILFFFIFSCRKNKETIFDPKKTYAGNLQISFLNYFDNRLLLLDSTTNAYNIDTNTSIVFTKLNYYISNIILVDDAGIEFVEPNSYHLIKTNAPNTNTINLKSVLASNYKKIIFTIGVDSTYKMKSTVNLDLDKSNEMFVSDSIGYATLKLEGILKTSPSLNFKHLIAGYKKPNRSVYATSINLPTSPVISENITPVIIVKLDMKSYFNNEILINNLNVNTTGIISQNFAKNFANAFKLKEIKN